MISSRFALRALSAIVLLGTAWLIYGMHQQSQRQVAEYEKSLTELREMYSKVEENEARIIRVIERDFLCTWVVGDLGSVNGEVQFFPSLLIRCSEYLSESDMQKVTDNLIKASQTSLIRFRDAHYFVAKFGGDTYAAQAYEEDGLTWYALPDEFEITNVTKIVLAECSESLDVSQVPAGVLVLTICD